MHRDALVCTQGRVQPRSGVLRPRTTTAHVLTTLESTMDKDRRLALGKAAREARKALGLTQEKVAEKLDVSVEFYGRIERGAAWPSVDVFARMIPILGASADSLLGVETGRTPGPAPLTLPDDSPEFRALLALVCKARPGVVRLVSALVHELESTRAARKSTAARGPNTRRTRPAPPL